MRRKWIYPSDGSAPYEVPVDHRGRPRVDAPTVHIFEPVVGTDGRIIRSKRELERQNAQGKSVHLNELRNMALDGHNEALRREQRDTQRRKQDLAKTLSGYGL